MIGLGNSLANLRPITGPLPFEAWLWRDGRERRRAFGSLEAAKLWLLDQDAASDEEYGVRCQGEILLFSEAIRERLRAAALDHCVFCQSPHPVVCDAEHGPLCDDCLDGLADGEEQLDAVACLFDSINFEP
jgi:hypothetical protein